MINSGYLDEELQFKEQEMEQRLYTTLGDVADLVNFSGGKVFVNELFTIDPRVAAELKEAFKSYDIPANYGVLLSRK